MNLERIIRKVAINHSPSLACLAPANVGLFSILKTLNPPKFKGKLSIVPTPIGNLDDLTPNILKCLFQADLIGCEDRRVAGQLYTLIKNRNIIQKME